MTMDAKQAEAEVEAHASAVFARMAGTSRRKPNRERVKPASRTAATKEPWFSGVEAALPKGDRD